MRRTKQREVILDELVKLRTHPSADELYGRVKKRLPRISLGTVYRNLEILSREGIIRRLETAGSQRRFDGDTGDHQHIRCVSCGCIDDLAAGADRARCDALVAKGTGYRVLGRRVEYLGICPSCRKKSGGS
ncbi:MAG: transcriptional repressor [Candidatus Krumholzibacteria bacterium]|nr:transcriptional repressor [Candidatus Krumholzibacteria bacterium]